MNFNKTDWKEEDIKEFNKYLESIKRENKIDFTKKIINTNMEVLGIDIPTLRKISKEINKGNSEIYLEKHNNQYYENTIINGCLINEIKDFNKKAYFLDELYIDNWSTCDILSFDIKNNEEKYWSLAKKYMKDKDTFKRRLGIRILFSYKKTKYVDEIFNIIDDFYDEKEYYVNMAIAWLICELMIYNREKTIKYFQSNHLNNFTINKAISKCRDSYRISKEDKDFLKQFKRY